MQDARVEVSRPASGMARELSSFVGREQEVEAVGRLLTEAPLVTLAGPGGAGKTRLAQRVARRVQGEAGWPSLTQEVAFVELAALGDPSLVPEAVASAIGAIAQPGRSVIESVIDALRPRRALVVLDNCEHLVAACAELAEALLLACREVRILATSREPLAVRGEAVFRVPPMRLPVRDDLDACTTSEAVQLFVQRARAVRSDFALDATTAPAVAAVCRRLDGLPLAIELAAARAASLAVSDIAARLETSTWFLAGGPRSAAPRQRTMRAAIAWSYDLLTQTEQRLFRRLAVFAGIFTLEDAEALGAPDLETLDAIGGLVTRSMLHLESAPATGQAYRLLEPVRQFGRDLLREAGELEDVNRRHALWMVSLVERAAAGWHGPDQSNWSRRVDLAWPNLRAAQDWAEAAGETEIALRLVAPMWVFWTRPDRQGEGLARLRRVLGLPDVPAHVHLKGRVLGVMAMLAFTQSDLPLAERAFNEALEVARAQHDAFLEASMLRVGGLVRLYGGQTSAAEALLDEALQVARRARMPDVETRVLDDLASVALARGEVEHAEHLVRESLRLARTGLDAWSLAMTLNTLGDLLRTRGDAVGAKAAYEEALPTLSAMYGGRPPHGMLHNLGYLAVARGQPRQAVDLFLDSAEGYRRSGADRRGLAECLIGLGVAALRLGRPELAARLFGSADGALAALGTTITPSNVADYERGRSELLAALDGRRLADLEAEGRALSLERALDMARGLQAEPAGAPSSTGVAGLTARELEVAELLAGGYRNREIAEQLVITEKTAANHVQRVLDKLGLTSRAQVAARALELGLTRREPDRT